MRYLQRQGELEERGPLRKREAWTRLSFTLTLRNPYFVNFTDVPNAMNPRRDNSYFTNQEAHRKPEIILNPETHVTWQDPLTVVSPEYRVPVSSQVREVRVLAISGEVVLCKPRCVPATVFERKNPADVDCSDASDDGPQVCTNTIYLDFSGLPEDKYTIQVIGTDGSIRSETKVLHTSAYPIPLCFIDLLFTNPAQVTNPTGQAAGIYPVRNLYTEPQIVSVAYELRFRRRFTRWRYYVVPQPDWKSLDDLRIIVERAPRKVHFTGRKLPDGVYRFVSDKGIPLQQQSEYWFQLRGTITRRNGLATPDDVLVDRLPVASILQVLPDVELTPDSGRVDCSDIYVYV